MNILAIDTSNQVLGVAIQQQGHITGEIVTNVSKNHSVRLMPAIEKLMKEVSLKPEALDQIIVAKGPGSYTGVRIGLSTAKSMAWALNIPIIGISSLEVLAYQGRFFNGLICPFFDARRGLVYSSCFKWEDNNMVMIEPEANMLMDEFLDKLKSYQHPVLFLSPDISVHQERIQEKLGNLAVIPDATFQLPRASHLIMAAKERSVDETHTLTPNYLRLAEAEAKWLEHQKRVNNE
ncbi:tRNA (adenosine(37)-N6)-threonylcarbamoyltransferase complex dimerization subunit type 1 TsaB [Virgibacillus salexigens]|uniref:T(6)A37 threonylcarbamoyladenosine biosynthesis protein n=2 Tax=Virgibacillus TaxID=84406 RepID=A0A024QG32_9BACI|nr:MULTISPECIES: tRNA (adenosine(37)-N6)-threonylcarbamoyltransferase complex dimerization subunit type 1 TsaB [Virgibacillus]MYL43582.1 tRNA (adenosine(37)-N6)-threonylcarbamoyltransferase complex dimerization subunit type 1 TsaB [Virgibacillus massiliensis]GGJ76559.1 tRNA (adenosine(37)-N6)-threonylcarbamoyltransferase complex dimerization subunit type 1 TsaB [Virgibacillus kapii]CDQ41454.1 t(6)A37 threonylcarbamoyladenosine biosynthesis protein [Virgibacillus massiliensis]